MPKDLQEKYSDPRLDPSESGFDEIVNRPDMKSLDDQGNAIARDSEASKARDAENRDVPISGEQSETGSSDANDSSESQASTRTEKKDKLQTNPQSKRNKIIGVGVGGGLIGGLLVSILMLLPLKIPGIMQMIADEAGQRAEQITERRAKIIVGRYVVSRYASNSGLVITGNGAVSTLFTSMRTSNFEKKLAARGLTFERAEGGVIMKVNDELLNDGKPVKNEVEFIRAMDGKPVSKKMLNDIVKEEIPSWRLMKRMKFAKWLRIKYNIPRYGIEESDKSDPEEAARDSNKERLSQELEYVANDIGDATGNILEGDAESLDPYAVEGNEIAEGASNAMSDAAQAEVDAVAESNANPNGKETASLLGNLSSKLGSKAIPVIGWIDLLATMNHFAYETSENDLLGKIAAFYRAKQYSRHYGVWSGYASQIQLGQMNPALTGLLATQTNGIEESEIFQMIQGNPGAGVKVVNKINANNPSSASKEVKAVFDTFGGYDSLGGKAVNEVLELWYDSANKVFEKFGELLGGLTPQSVEDWMAGFMGKAMSKLMAAIGLDFDPTTKGPEWLTAAHGGATWSYNYFAKEVLGAHKLSASQTNLQNQSIARERTEYKQQQGVLYSLFSTENTSSLTSKLAISTPTNLVSFTASLGSMVTETPSTLFGLVSNKSMAGGYVDIHGVDPMGATDEELNAPLDPTVAAGDVCPETVESQLNTCMADTEVVGAMQCFFTPDTEECAEDDVSVDPSETAGSFTVASYNILHADSHTDKSRAIGGCNTNPVQDDPTCGKTRAEHQVKIITGQNGNPAFDIFGTQETSPLQFNYLKSRLPDYGAFPNDTSRMNNRDDGALGIFWNKNKFSLFDSGKARGKSNTSFYISNPWVGLQTSSGQKIYVMSIHYAVAGFGGTPESIRESSQLTMDWVKSVATDDAIVIVLGDFNDRLTEKLSYCVYTNNGLMQHAVDMKAGANPDKGCTANRFGGIDHIFSTTNQGIKAARWVPMANEGIVRRASDHTPVYATYELPGSSESTGAWSWPVDKKWWDTAKEDFLGAHPTYSYTFTSPSVAGMGADIGDPPDGSPVYSMLDGTVTKTNLCGDGDGMIIESKTIEGTINIAYGHGTNPRFKVGDTVKSGQQILDLGATGCRVEGGHLHVDIAIGQKHVCPQDVFIAMGAGLTPDLISLAADSKSRSPCGR